MLNLRHWFSGQRESLEHLYLFVHLPKCAGTSVLRTLATVGDRNCVTVAETPGKSHALESVRRQMNEQNIDGQQLNLIMGRDVYYGMHCVSPKPPRYFTFLRDPLERYVSQFRFYVDCVNNSSHKAHELSKERVVRGGQMMTLDDYIDSKQGTNLIAKVLAVANNSEGSEDRWWSAKARTCKPDAKEMLDRMSFIGFVESFEQDAAMVCNQLQIDCNVKHVNASKTPVELPAATLERIRELNALDVEVCEYARELAASRSFDG